MDDWTEHTAVSKDELHVSLGLPAHVADEIEAWVKDQDWPRGTEFEDRSEYHITLLYAPEGHGEHQEEDWLPQAERVQCEIIGLDEFGTDDKKAIVLRLDSPEASLLAADAQDAAERRDVPINRFPGGYKPHITVAYSVRKPPYARAPKIKFKSGPSSVSTPRTSAVDWHEFDNTTGVPCPLCHSMYTTPYKGDRIHCMGCGKTSPAPNLLNMVPVQQTPEWGHDDWHFAAMDPPPPPPPLDWYYHVAPTDQRESIRSQGLVGHLKGHTESPWAERRKQWKGQPSGVQPPGNYLFSDVDDARDYALGHPSQKAYENDDDARENVAPDGLVHWDGAGQGYTYDEDASQQPEDWDEAAHGNWYDSPEYEEAVDSAYDSPINFDHENPDHTHQLTQPGFDIWKVPARGLNVLPDPEQAILEGGWMTGDQAIDKFRPGAEPGDHSDPQNPADYNWQDWEQTHEHGAGPLRWYSPGHIPPEQLQLHEWVPPWANTGEESQHRMDGEEGRMTDLDTPLYEREYPTPLHQIHPTALPLTPPPWSLTSSLPGMSTPLEELRAQHPYVDWLPRENDTSVSTGGYIKVAPENRGNGYARAAMQALCDHADSVQKPIPLSPTNEWGSSRPRLERFYRSLGFVPNKGRNKDWQFMSSFIRPPNPR